jgi:hypothetical protein
MSVTAKVDQRKLEASLRKFSKGFGESSAQATIRWAVQTCRQLARETAPWGGKKASGSSLSPQKQQQGAIMADILNVVYAVQSARKVAAGWVVRSNGKRYFMPDDKFLTDAESVIRWVASNRARRRRTRRLSGDTRKACTIRTAKAAAKEKMKRAGMAKGAWLGAGQKIARSQKGMDKVDIGASLLKFAQRSGASYGDAKAPSNGWNPTSTIKNNARHSSIEYVLSRKSINKAISDGLRNTVKWYSKSIRALNRKKS